MTEDYFEAKHTGGSKDSIEITVDVKADKVMYFANEIRDTTIDRVLEIINRAKYNAHAWDESEYGMACKDIREAVLVLKGGDDGM